MQNNQLLADILDSDRNSFNLVRLFASLSVLITPFTLGQHAVNAFFVLSGLMLSHSLARNPDLVHYAWSRFLRIVPGLFAFGLAFAFIAGPVLTSLRLIDYFSDAHTWMYPVAVLFEFARATSPHQIFPHGPYAEAANNPLWTIKYEIAAYIGLAVFFHFGLVRKSAAAIAALILTLLIFIFAPHSEQPDGSAWLYQLGRYGFCFLLGVLAGIGCHSRHVFLLYPSASLP